MWTKYSVNIVVWVKNSPKEFGLYLIDNKECLMFMGNCTRSKKLGFVKANFRVDSLKRGSN